MLEREMKLLVAPEVEVSGLDGAVPDAELGLPEERAIHDVYYDTADLRLARWGCTLRHREAEGWTVKIPAPGTGRLMAREEIVMPGDPETPPSELLALVRSLTRGEPVDVVARFDTARTAHTWRDPDGGMVVEVVDDRVTVESTSGAKQWRELEVELAPETAEKVAKRILKRLRRAIVAATPDGADSARSAPERRPKLIHAIGAEAEAPPDVVEPVVGDQPTGREVIQAAIARSVTRLVLHLPAARVGEDIEGVHQARVATRRLRSDLRSFRPLLDPEWSAALAEELRWLADDLGQVRDADVLLTRLQATVDASPDLAGVATNRVLTSLQRQRKRHMTRLLTDLDSERADHLLDHLVGAAADPRTVAKADDRASERLGSLVAKRWRRLAAAIDALDDPPVVGDLHRVRILAKRVRYSAEAAIPAYGAEAKALAKATAGIQDALGELNDAAMAEAWLSALAERTKGSTAFSAGRLCQAIATDALPHWDQWRKQAKRAGRAADHFTP